MPPSLLPASASSVTLACRGAVVSGSHQCVRTFSSTAAASARTLQRRDMFKWLNGPGSKLREPLPNSTNYLSAYNKSGELKRAIQMQPGEILPSERPSDLKPFPPNENFLSQPVTSEELRENIWTAIMNDGLSVKEVSARYRVEMSRVGAIVRLKEIEKEWLRQGKRLAKPYSRAISSMLPQHEPGTEFESINDLPSHRATEQQIFWPASESRPFKRTDAARVFDDALLTAEQRIPHPELVIAAKELIEGLGPKDRAVNMEARYKKENDEKYARDLKKMAKDAAAVKTVQGARWDFKFRDMRVEDAGTDGRGLKGVGWRYGAPLRDRKRSEVKIPTSA